MASGTLAGELSLNQCDLTAVIHLVGVKIAITHCFLKEQPSPWPKTAQLTDGPRQVRRTLPPAPILISLPPFYLFIFFFFLLLVSPTHTARDRVT